MLGDEKLVHDALTDLETCALGPKEKALLRFVAKVNHNAPSIGPEDMSTLHEAGWSDEAIYFAITVCALFNFYNRWIDAAGVHAMSDEAHCKYAARTAEHGYIRK